MTRRTELRVGRTNEDEVATRWKEMIEKIEWKKEEKNEEVAGRRYVDHLGLVFNTL